MVESWSDLDRGSEALYIWVRRARENSYGSQGNANVIHRRKKDGAVHFTTMPCDPNTAYKAQRKPSFYNICPCAKDTKERRFERFITVLYVFVNVILGLHRHTIKKVIRKPFSE